MNQAEDARKSILAPGEPFKESMAALNDFLKDAERIWSHATFDFVLLTNTLKRLDIKPLFSYKAGMDLRTLVYLAGITAKDFPRAGVHHDGLDDALHQVTYAVAAMNAIRGNKTLVKALTKLLA